MFDFNSNESPILDATESIYESAKDSSLYKKVVFVNIEADKWKIIMERASIVWLIILILIYIIKYK